MAKKKAETSFEYRPPPKPGAGDNSGSSEVLKRIESKLDEMQKKQDEKFKYLAEQLTALPAELIEKMREAMTG